MNWVKFFTEIYKQSVTDKPKKPRKSKKSSDDEEEPKKKREPTKYNIFVKEQLPIIKEKFPQLSREDLMRKVGELWKNKISSTSPKRSSSPKLPSPPKRSSPPNPPPLPSAPKRSSPKKSKSKITAETLQTAKSKLKPKPKSKSPSPPKKRSSPDPTDPNYELEMAFRKLEKKQERKKNKDLPNSELEKLFKRK